MTELEWGDRVAVMQDPSDDAAVFLGVYDADTDASATAALNLDEAENLAGELSSAVAAKRAAQ